MAERVEQAHETPRTAPAGGPAAWPLEVPEMADLPPARVLLVDDKPQNLLALEAILSPLQLEVVTAGSGEETLRWLLQDEFAVILLDVCMPGMDGLRTAVLIRGHEQSRHTPIIFLTAWGSGDAVVTRCYSLRAVDYIIKPLQPHIVRSKVAVFVELFQKTARLRQQAAHLARLNEELEARVAARTAALQRAVRIRDDFLAMAGHELRTPLTALHGAVQTLLRDARHGTLGDPLPDRLQRLLTVIEKQDERLIHLVNNLLDALRLSEGRLELGLEAVDLGALVHEVVACFGEEIARARCRLEVQAPDHVVGLWDRSRLEQVVTTLLTNALKYGAGTEVTISVSADEGSARLAVADRGIGIAAEHVERIFGRFERAVPAKEYSGVGLGLSIARDIVEALGGTIGVISEPGGGATFTAALPLRALALSAPPQHAGQA